MYKPTLITLIMVTLGNCGVAYASRMPELPTNRAVAAIIGEVSGEGGANLELKYRAMLACAHAIRNRGTLKGVYGEHAPHVKNEPEWVWDLAKRAWIQSAFDKALGIDPTFGATHWENVKKFGRPYWMKGMEITVNIGSHVYMKRKGGA